MRFLGWYLLTATAMFIVTGCGDKHKNESPPLTDNITTGLCNSVTGLRDPLPACSSQTPCTRIASELKNTPVITTETITPICDAQLWDERLTHDVLGFTRHACVHRPDGASSTSQRPLLLWFHPGGAGDADLAATETDLLNKAESFDLSGDPARPGFILASVQGRNLRFPTAAPRDGRHHDFYYRDIASPSSNPDIANADALIDRLVEEGIVDTHRIFVSGWSNGAFFSQLFAIARYETATPGGNRVAAASVFTAASPFGDISWDPFNESTELGEVSCAIDAPQTTVPIFIVYRSSDAAVACNDMQAMCFSTEPGYTTDDWITTATNEGLAISGLRLGGLESNSPVSLDAVAQSCTDYSAGCPVGACNTAPLGDTCLSLVNHSRWPDGVYNNFPFNGVDREVDILTFLRDNPRP